MAFQERSDEEILEEILDDVECIKCNIELLQISRKQRGEKGGIMVAERKPNIYEDLIKLLQISRKQREEKGGIIVDKEPLSEGLVNIIRGFTRPVLTLFGLVSVVMMRVNGIEPPVGFEPLVYGMILWWFGDRTYFKVKSKGGEKK